MGAFQQKLTLLFPSLGLVQLAQLFNQGVLGAGDGSNVTGQWIHLPKYAWAEIEDKLSLSSRGGRFGKT
jgi:hypothetical protein